MLPLTDTITPADFTPGDVLSYGPFEDGSIRLVVVTEHTVHPSPGFDGYVMSDQLHTVHGQNDKIVRVLGRYRRAVLIAEVATADNLRAVERHLPANYHATINCNQILIEGWDVKGATLVGHVFPRFAKMGARIREIPLP